MKILPFSQRRHLRAAFFIAMLWVSAAHSAPRLQFRVTDLGTLPGGQFAAPRAVNIHGDVVGTAPNSNGIYRPFLYRDGVMSELNVGDANGSGEGLDINDAGELIALATVTNFYRAYFISPQGIIDVNEQTGLRIFPERMNQAGQFVGRIPKGFSSEAISWSNGVVRRLGVLEPDNASMAYDINNLDDAVGVAYVTDTPFSGARAVLFRDGGISVLGRFGARALNDRGEIAGDLEGSTGIHVAFYRAGSLMDLGTLPGDRHAWAWDINNAGQIVGVSEDGAERPRAFLYINGQMHDLNDLLKARSGWILAAAFGINDKGQIVGVGYHDGLERPFLLTLIGHGKVKD